MSARSPRHRWHGGLPCIALALASCVDECDTPEVDPGSTGQGTSSAASSTGDDGTDAPGTMGPGPTSDTSGTTHAPDTSGSDGDTDAQNAVPVAADDELFGRQDQGLAIARNDVLGNDVDADGDALTVVAADAASTTGGAILLELDGTITYQPPPGFWGVDRFSYTTSDGVAQSSATVTVHVAPSLVQLATVAQGIGGFSIDGEAAGDASGHAVSEATDIDGDGLADLVIGAPAAGPGGPVSGRGYVVFGKADTAAVALADVSMGAGGFALHGVNTWDEAGVAVGGAGDVDGDGLGDLIIGARGADPHGYSSGRSYVVFGTADTEARSLDQITQGVGGFVIDGEAVLDGSGRSVAGAGDVNGDGMGDLIVGAYRSAADGYSAGRSYVVFGKATTGGVDASDVVDGVGGFAILGEGPYSFTGFAVAGAGDVNADGLDDVLISARLFPASDAIGRTYVVFGKPDTGTVALADVAQGVGGFALDGEENDDHSGNSVRGAGDVDGDGFDDLVIGAYLAGSENQAPGRTYVVFGRADTGLFALADVADGVGGFAIDGEAVGDRSGKSVSGAGDVNGDGLADLVLGADNASPHGVASGRAYVVYGKPGTERVALADVSLGIGGFALDGETLEDTAGFAVAGGGDLNGDGLDDVVIGARGADPGRRAGAGRSYVVFGVRTAPSRAR